ncbi:hypothetical protein ACFL2F_00110 [Myxococcota bacterium]
MLRVLVSLILTFSLFYGQLARAEDQRLPAVHRVAILLKMLTYDQRLKLRCRNGIRIGVIGVSKDKDSMAVAQETFQAMEKGKGKRIEGLPLTVDIVEIKDSKDVWKAVDKKSLNILYLSPGLEGMLKKISGFAQAKKILLITGEAEHLKSGAALGAVLRGEKPKILLHQKAAVSQGADFDVRMSRIVERVD